MTRPVCERFSSTGSVSAIHALPVPVMTSWRRLEAVSSGPKTRKFFSVDVGLHHGVKQLAEDAGGLDSRAGRGLRFARRSRGSWAR